MDPKPSARRWSGTSRLLGLLLALGTCRVAQADVLVRFRNGESPTAAYAGANDTRVEDGRDYFWQDTVNYDRTGLLVDRFPAVVRSLLRFDLSALPTQAVVTAVRLTLYVENASPSPSPPVKGILKAWNETTVTWLLTDGVTPWQVPGASGATDVGATLCTLPASTTGALGCTFNATGISLVGQWIASPATNHGLLLEDISVDSVRWSSSESTTVTRRPQLQVDYTVSGVPASATFQNGVAGYNGTTDASIGQGPDPTTLNFDSESLLVSSPADVSTSSSLFRFDVSTLPRWAQVTDASLALRAATSNSTQLSAYAMLRSWTVDQVTWRTTEGTTPWEVVGGFGATDRASQPFAQWTSPVAGMQEIPIGGAAALIESWAQGGPNNGFKVEVDASALPSVRYHTSQHATVSERPRLTVQYLEGRVFPLAGPPDSNNPQSLPFFLRRESLTQVGLDLSVGPLDAEVTTTGDGELSTSATGPFGPSVLVPFATGVVDSPVLYARSFDGGALHLQVDAGAAWQSEQGVLNPPAEPSDGGTGNDLDAGQDGGPPIDPAWPEPHASQRHLHVGCTSGGDAASATVFLSFFFLAHQALRRRRLTPKGSSSARGRRA